MDKSENPIRNLILWVLLPVIICIILPIMTKTIIDEDNKTCIKGVARELSVEADYREIGEEYGRRITEILRVEKLDDGIKLLEQYGKVYKSGWHQVKNKYKTIDITINPCNFRINGWIFTLVYTIDGGFKDTIPIFDD